jgi:CRP-like cAMP-binding protein
LKKEQWQICAYGDKSFLGEDDVLLGTKHMTSALCTDVNAEILRIPREKFLALIAAYPLVQNVFKSHSIQKRHKFRIFIEQKRKICAQDAKNSSEHLRNLEQDRSRQSLRTSSYSLLPSTAQTLRITKTNYFQQPSALPPNSSSVQFRSTSQSIHQRSSTLTQQTPFDGGKRA